MTPIGLLRYFSRRILKWSAVAYTSIPRFSIKTNGGFVLAFLIVTHKAELIGRNHGYMGVSSSRNRMVRGNGSVRVETGVKATARPSTIRITMRCGPLRDSLDDLSTIIIAPLARNVQRNGS